MFLMNLLAAAKHAVADWRRRQQAYAELSALDDHALADIGIRRSDIPAIVEGVRGPRRGTADSDFADYSPRHAQFAGGQKGYPLFPYF
jgi:uncharacterized protein YjiS (DUF1127 family)